MVRLTKLFQDTAFQAFRMLLCGASGYGVQYYGVKTDSSYQTGYHL